MFRNNQTKRNIGVLLMAVAVMAMAETAPADTLVVVENQVTSTSLYETTPTLGNDGTGDLVVYTARELLDTGFFDQGDIWYQRLAAGAPVGAAVQVTSDITDDQLNDVSGDYIVYTAYDNTMSLTGTIMLYQISTDILQPIGDPLIIHEPRIYGNTVVWVQGGYGASEVMIYDLAWLGTTQTAESLTGPVPPTFNVDIGDRFVVWVEQDGDTDIGAYDLIKNVRLGLTNTPSIDERQPSTSGDWVVWESQDIGASGKRIEAVNLETGDYRIILDDGSVASRPSIDGDLIAYETKRDYNCDVGSWMGIQQVAAEGYHTVGLKTDGTVVAVGWNYYGQCDVGSWSGIQQVAAGGCHTVGLKTDGTVVAVGWYWGGACDVGSWSGIQQVAAREGHTVGLKTDGTVVAVGWNYYGQCDVGSWTNIQQVAAGSHHTVGLKTHTVVAVGGNDDDQCDVGSWMGIQQVAAGGYHTVGLKTDGTVVAVGRNERGQCDVGSWTNIQQVAAGEYHTVGLKTDGTVVAVGYNGYGQCDVGSWTNIQQVAAGGFHTVGVKTDGTVLAVGYGQSDVYLYRISTAETFQVTTDPHHQYLSDVFGDLVAYVDLRTGDEDVWVASLTWVPGLPAPGYQPSGLAYDGTYLYVSELSGFRTIYKLNPESGAVVGSFLAPSPTGLDGCGNTNGLAYDGAGHLFVSDIGDSGAGVVYETDTAGTTIFNSFSLPFRGGAISFDGTYLYVGDLDSSNIVVMDRSGTVIRTFDSQLRPAGMTFDPTSGQLVVISEFDGEISRITTNGDMLCSFDGPREPGIQGLGGVTIVDSNLYIAEVSDPDPYNDPKIPGTIYITPLLNCPPDIDVSPLEYDFAEVELGTSSTVIVTISNVGGAPLTVDSIAFETGSSGDFCITSVPTLPAVIPAGGTSVDVEITYTPSAVVLSSAVLNISSDDPDEPLVAVSLSGTGVEAEPPLSEQIQAILDFFDASVDDGTLVGDGPGRSAGKRLNALRNMIETAGDLIEDDLLDDACQQLQDAYKKTDGEPRPPDFVTGEAASELANLIQELMTNMGCE